MENKTKTLSDLMELAFQQKIGKEIHKYVRWKNAVKTNRGKEPGSDGMCSGKHF